MPRPKPSTLPAFVIFVVALAVPPMPDPNNEKPLALAVDAPTTPEPYRLYALDSPSFVIAVLAMAEPPWAVPTAEKPLAFAVE